MKLLHISDTHGLHNELKHLPDADILVHSGDFTLDGKEQEALDFINWLCDLPHRHKIFIAGNHDLCMYDAGINGLPDNVHYLNNSHVTIEGLKIHGMPMFSEDIISGDDIKNTEAIPDDADIVVTHQPPMGILDLSEGINYGCMFLLARITAVSPACHLFGHVHNSYGITHIGNTIFSNAAVLDEDYRLKNEPRLLDLNKKQHS